MKIPLILTGLLFIMIIPSAFADYSYIEDDGTFMIIGENGERGDLLANLDFGSDDFSIDTHLDAISDLKREYNLTPIQENCGIFTEITTCVGWGHKWSFKSLSQYSELKDSYEDLKFHESNMKRIITENLHLAEPYLSDPKLLKSLPDRQVIQILEILSESIMAVSDYEQAFKDYTDRLAFFNMKFQAWKQIDKLQHQGDDKLEMFESKKKILEIRDKVKGFKVDPPHKLPDIKQLLHLKLTIYLPDDEERLSDDELLDKAVDAERAGDLHKFAFENKVLSEIEQNQMLQKVLEFFKLLPEGNYVYDHRTDTLYLPADPKVKVSKDELQKNFEIYEEAYKEYQNELINLNKQIERNIDIQKQLVEKQEKHEEMQERQSVLKEWEDRITENYKTNLTEMEKLELEQKDLIHQMIDNTENIQEIRKKLQENTLKILKLKESKNPKNLIQFKSTSPNEILLGTSVSSCDINHLTNVGAFEDIVDCGDKDNPDVIYANIKIGNYMVESDEDGYFKALSLIEQGDYNGAITILESTKSSQDKPTPTVILNLARSYQLNGDYVNAAYLFSMYSEKIDAVNGYAYNNYSIGNYETAIVFYEKALELNDKHIDAYNGLGMVYRTINDLDTAEYYYDLALELNPENKDTLDGLSRLNN